MNTLPEGTIRCRVIRQQREQYGIADEQGNEYATEAEAVQVRRAVLAQEGTPGWHTVYFQKGNTVCTLDWSYGERTTDREERLYQHAFDTLSAAYGEFIPKN